MIFYDDDWAHPYKSLKYSGTWDDKIPKVQYIATQDLTEAIARPWYQELSYEELIQKIADTLGSPTFRNQPDVSSAKRLEFERLVLTKADPEFSVKITDII